MKIEVIWRFTLVISWILSYPQNGSMSHSLTGSVLFIQTKGEREMEKESNMAQSTKQKQQQKRIKCISKLLSRKFVRMFHQ